MVFAHIYQGNGNVGFIFLLPGGESEAGLALCFPTLGRVSEPLANEKVATSGETGWLGNDTASTDSIFSLLQPDLCFLLVSGRTGSPMGRPVKYSIVGVGNLIGPQVYVTTNGAVYILFGFGKKQS